MSASYIDGRAEANRISEQRRLNLRADHDRPISIGDAVDIVLDGMGLNRFRRIVIIIGTAVEEGIRCSDEIERRVRDVMPETTKMEIEDAAVMLLEHLVQAAVEGEAA